MFSNAFPKNCAACEIMSKNVVELEAAGSMLNARYLLDK